MWKLVIEDDEGKRTVVPLTREQYSLGRKEGNTIRLTERNVSREHARIVKKSGDPADAPDSAPAFLLEDLTSYNGVFVNGLRVTHAQDISHGDLVQIGDYRIVLQDEAIDDTRTDQAPLDTKQTLRDAPAGRGSSLLDRPDRLVMLAGPSPGTEYPLDQERMTIGRAEDASISLNHSSVSRLHCEVHALGDGRFEIGDKGSSNGVRVNGADLRRGIIEPGDIIELGDVVLKFVGAGQIFRPAEGLTLTTVDERAANGEGGARRGATMLPLAVFGVVVIAGALGAWTYTRPRTAARPLPAAAALVDPSPEDVALADAIKAFASGDCEGAHRKLAGIGAGSPVRASRDFHDVENKWADQVLAAGDAEPDPAQKRALYQRVSQAMTVEPGRRNAAADKLQALDAVAALNAATPSSLPVAPAPVPGGNVQEVGAARRADGRIDAGRRAGSLPEASGSPGAAPAALSPAGISEDRERLLALQESTDAKTTLKSQLEQKVYSGRATDSEIRLLIATCKELGDKLCVAQARQQQDHEP